MPGSPLDPRAAGANCLLKQGAVIVTEAGDVIDFLRPIMGDLPSLSDELAEAPPEPVSLTDEPTAGRLGRSRPAGRG